MPLPRNCWRRWRIEQSERTTQFRSLATMDIAELLKGARTIAVIGASDRPDRPSYGVMRFLQDWGYRVLPVNPQITGEHVLGEFVWRELAQIGIPIDIVDIFRRPDAVKQAVEQAILVGRESGVDAARRDRRGSCRPSGSRWSQGRYGPLPAHRDSAAWGAENQRRSLSGSDSHFRNENRRSVDTPAELEVASRLQAREHFDEIASDRDFGNCFRDLASAHHEA